MDWAFANGTSHDFSNPVEYVLTAPDGVTKITYTVTVVFYDDSQGGSEETPHIHTWDTGAVTKKPTCRRWTKDLYLYRVQRDKTGKH